MAVGNPNKGSAEPGHQDGDSRRIVPSEITEATAAHAANPISRKQRQRALAAARQAPPRPPQARHRRPIRVEVFEREIDALIRRGLIDAEQRADRGEIRVALYKLFDSTISRW